MPPSKKADPAATTLSEKSADAPVTEDTATTEETSNEPGTGGPTEGDGSTATGDAGSAEPNAGAGEPNGTQAGEEGGAGAGADQSTVTDPTDGDGDDLDTVLADAHEDPIEEVVASEPVTPYDEVLGKVTIILSRYTPAHKEGVEVTRETNLYGDLNLSHGLDDDIAEDLEDEFGIIVSGSESGNFATVHDMVQLVLRKQGRLSTL